MKELNYPKRSIVVLNPLADGGEIDVQEIEKDSLEQMYRVIGCSYVDHFNIPELEKNHIDVWLNDDGVLETLEPNIVLFNNDGRCCNELRGTLVFAKFTDDGETIGLKRKDVEFIKNWISVRLGRCFNNNGKSFYAYQYDYDYLEESYRWYKEMEKLGFKPL